MYYWKIWRDTRVAFFVLLALGVFLAWLLARTQAGDALAATWPGPAQHLPVEAASRAWASGMNVLMAVGALVVYFVGLELGASGLGDEIEHGTAAFLLTRPRPRGYFVWSFSVFAGLELLAFTSVVMIAGYATLFHMVRRPGPWSFLLIAPMLMITGLLAIAAASLLTTASRRSKNGVMGGLALTVAYLAILLLSRLAEKRYGIPRLPSPFSIYNLSWSISLAGSMLGWFAAAVAVIALTHVIVRRMEI